MSATVMISIEMGSSLRKADRKFLDNAPINALGRKPKVAPYRVGMMGVVARVFLAIYVVPALADRFESTPLFKEYVDLSRGHSSKA